MKQSTKDRATGNAHEIKGKIKKEAGRILKKPALQDEGADEELTGKVQRKVGEVEKVAGF
jgi:uncharacterized protein YjbJ (UPF0337 family)